MAKKRMILPVDTGGMLDHIVKHLTDPTYELTPAAHLKMERMKSAFRLLVSHGSDFTANQLLTQMYSLSKTQAYNDIQDAKRVFGFEEVGSEFFNRNLILHHAWQSFLRCVAKGEEKAAATFLNIIAKHGIKEEDTKELNIEDIMNIQFNITNNIAQMVQGAEVISDKRKSELRKKYLGRVIDSADGHE